MTMFHKNMDTIWVYDAEAGSWAALTIEERIEKTVQVVVDAARERWNAAFGGFYPSGGQVGRRNLRPTDVGLPTATMRRWQMTTAGGITAAALSAWIAAAVIGANDNAFAIITGLHYTDVNPVIHEMQMTIGGKQNPPWNIEEIFAKLEPEFYFKKPVVCTPDTQLTIQVTASVATTVQQIGLHGEIISKQAYAITF